MKRVKNRLISITLVVLFIASNFMTGLSNVFAAATGKVSFTVYPTVVYENEQFAFAALNTGDKLSGETVKFNAYNSKNSYGYSSVLKSDGTYTKAGSYADINLGATTAIVGKDKTTPIEPVSFRLKTYPDKTNSDTRSNITVISDKSKYGYIAGTVKGDKGDIVAAYDGAGNIIATSQVAADKSIKVAVQNGTGITLAVLNNDGSKKSPVYGSYTVKGVETTNLIDQNSPLNPKNISDQTLFVEGNSINFTTSDLFTDTDSKAVITLESVKAEDAGAVDTKISDDKKSITLSANASVSSAKNTTVTITAKNDKGYTAECQIKVTVNPKDTTAPVITHTPVTSGTAGNSINILATVTDNNSVAGVKLFYRVKGETQYTSLDMTGNKTYSATIPEDKVKAAGIEYYISATDGKNTATSPIDSSTPYSIAISNAVDPNSLNIYFGQLHSHTTNSDGIGSLDDAYSYAKTHAKLDFFAVTDHSNSFDNDTTSSVLDGSKSTKWINGHDAADKYTDSKFVGIYGYEMTWADGTGHMNAFNTAGFETRNNKKYSGADGLKQYFEALKQSPNSISQFNHPGTTFGDFEDFADYDPVIDKLVTLVEVGNGEGAIGSSGYFPSYKYYDRALQKGWHLAPTNNQDNHQGKWGDANTGRSVILAQNLTRDSVYDAIKNRRVYATEDNDLKINYTLNGNEMGTILTNKPSSVDIKVNLEDPDKEALGEVSVITEGGKVVTSKNLTTSKDSLEFKLNPDYAYYYIKVVEADKDIAVTAPVWIGEVDKAGISSTTSSTTMPIKNQKMTVTSNFYNNESTAMKIKSLQYSIDGKVINTASNVSDVEPLKTGSYSFDYTPTKAGKYNIDVKLTAVVNGVEKIYTDVLKLTVSDPAIVTNIVIDASHYNDYVGGYYAGNIKNLTTLAGNENINVIVQKGKLTDDVLKDAKLLILSSPAKKTGTDKNTGTAYTASPYTDEDIAVIKRFTANGGNIIVNGLADYQDNKTDNIHTSAEQNKILEAIGAGSRINDDEVVDYENNPNAKSTLSNDKDTYGTPYRVPMSVYNTSSPYLKDVVKDQKYSFYSGCSITLGKDAEWLVKGTPTTYGFDSDNDKSGGSYVKAANKEMPKDTGIGKGNVVALATEKLPGGGRLFIGGTAFYSDFEIKVSLDNYSQLQNSNYDITMNILDSIKKEIPVTPIRDIRAAENGSVFCAEGIVTAGTKSGNAFFDTIYIQDKTGGINIYPVSGTDIKVGQKVKVTGAVDEYLGDKELRVINAEVTDTSVNEVAPTLMTTKDAMDSKNGGMLAKVQGTITKVDVTNGVVQAIYVKDQSGVEARLFIDGYIGYSNTNSAKLEDIAKVGNVISGIGLTSTDPDGNRLRVRDRSEIVLVSTASQEADKEAAASVIDKINSLPDKVTLADKAKVDEVMAAYNSLTASQKVLVTNLSKLIAADAEIKELQEKADAEQSSTAAQDKNKNTASLPKTGSEVDSERMVGMGVMLMILGMGAIIASKKRKMSKR